MASFFLKTCVPLLILMIFWKALYNSDSSPGAVFVLGVGAAVHMGGGHYVSCVRDSQCGQGFRCDPDRKQCLCNNQFFPKKKILRDRHAVFYDRKLGVCVAPLGKLCTLYPTDELLQIGCGPYAFCAAERGGKEFPRDVFGFCQCKSGFEDNLCGSDEPMPSMAHRVGPPQPVKNMGVEKRTDKASKKSPSKKTGNGKPVVVEVQVNRRNEDIDSSGEEANDQWSYYELPENGASQIFKSSGYLIIGAMFLAGFF